MATSTKNAHITFQLKKMYDNHMYPEIMIKTIESIHKKDMLYNFTIVPSDEVDIRTAVDVPIHHVIGMINVINKKWREENIKCSCCSYE